jgi:hypothetical protein
MNQDRGALAQGCRGLGQIDQPDLAIGARDRGLGMADRERWRFGKAQDGAGTRKRGRGQTVHAGWGISGRAAV